MLIKYLMIFKYLKTHILCFYPLFLHFKCPFYCIIAIYCKNNGKLQWVPMCEERISYVCNHSPPLECKMPATWLWQKQKVEGHVKYRNNDLATAFPNPTHLILCPLWPKSMFCLSWFQTLREINSSHLRSTVSTILWRQKLC